MSACYDGSFERRFGCGYEEWGERHTCAECDECELAADEYPDLDVPRAVAMCRLRYDWTDATKPCSDMCEGAAWWPKEARDA